MLLVCLRMCVYKKPQSETGNKRLREPHRPGVPREQVQRSRRKNKGRIQHPKRAPLSLLSSCPPHQLTQLQQTSPMLSSTTCLLKP